MIQFRNNIWVGICCLFLGFTLVESHHSFQREVIVQIAPEKPIDQILKNLKNKGAHLALEKLLSEQFGIYLLKVFDQATLKMLQKWPEIIHFQYNEQVSFRKSPNDLWFSRQWGFQFIGMDKAWEVSTGGTTVSGDTIVVAILDEGFDTQHEDLLENIWINHAEIPGDSMDNDGNGYVDDVMGWNFPSQSPVHQVSSHGQSVAGIIGAKGNNEVGVAGINWNIKLMLFTIGSIDDIIAAYDYVIFQRQAYNQSGGKQGAFVVATNASFGIDGAFCTDYPIWESMYDKLGEAGILTGAGTSNQNWDVDQVGDVPTTCQSNYLLTTLNLEENGQKSPNSAFGKLSIDLGSPGENSYTTKLYDRYGAFGSNSAAAPHLTGVIALLYAGLCDAEAKKALVQPSEVALFVRDAILGGVQGNKNLENQTVSGGVLNAPAAFNLAASHCQSRPTEDLQLTNLYPNPAQLDINIDYQTIDFEKHQWWVYNVLGQPLLSGEFIPALSGKGTFSISVESLASGTYLFALQNREKQVVRKFIK